MRSKGSRAGIERKILTSILWVGILPIAFALIIGYGTARTGQKNAVRQTLLTAAQKTAEGIRLFTTSRLNEAGHLARDPDVLAFLNSTATPERAQQLAERLGTMLDQSGEGLAVVSLYDASGRRVLSTNDLHSLAQIEEKWLADAGQPSYRSFGYSPEGEGFWALVLVAVRSDDGAEVIGYVTTRVGANSVLSYAMAQTSFNPGPEGETPDQYHYQVLYIAEDETAMQLQFGRNSPEGPRSLMLSAPSPAVRRMLSEGHLSGSQSMKDYKVPGTEAAADVLLAYSQMWTGYGNQRVYLLVYRPAADVFFVINVLSSVAVFLCVIAIALLCIKAFRDVHNDIVRPVSLLNEGAQIVRQGDFDLKLKIGTGDEIEELATSFNKMAVALKRNMRQLEESEEKYRTLVTSMRDGLYQTDKSGRIAFLNPAAVEILGFEREEDAYGADLAQMFSGEVNFAPDADDGSAEDTGPRPRFWIERKDGRVICVELSRNKVFDESGRPTGMEGAIRDVTKNVEVEEESRQRSERISAINQIANVINSSLEAGRLYESLVVELKKLVDFDYAAVALLADDSLKFDGRQLWPDEEVDPGYTFSLDNQDSSSAWVARERSNLLIDDLAGDHSPFAADFPDFVRSCLCVPLYATGRIIGTLNLGNELPGAFSKQGVEALEQMAPHLAVAIRNALLLVNLQLSLEEVTRAREKLHEANEELKTLDEMKTNLLSNVSHELRTPLVSVMGYNDMILNGKAGPITKTQQEYLGISLRNIEKLVTLIENLLDFSKLHRGDERIVFDAFDLVDCARTSIQVVQPVAESCEVLIDLVVPTSPILVEGDRAKMGQVFNNLLSNAVKFNKPGGSVNIDLKVGPESAEVVVSDTGIGIEPEALDKIFTRFYQIDASSTRKYGGTGIGLSIALDIVRLHGSSIAVTSEKGKGSVFRFSLPLAETTREEFAPGTRALTSSEDTHVLIELLSSDRALSVELRDLLYSEGLDMIHASSSDGAISLALKHRPDCIVVDVSNPAEDEAVLKGLLDNTATNGIPIAVLTNDDAFYEQYRSVVSTRIKRSFRKSSFLSGIQHALSKAHDTGEVLGERVLCVDDDPEILTFIQRCLEAEGVTVDRCTSGEEAIRMVRGRNYGLVLLDIAMPGMDGWETCQRIKSDPDLQGIKIYMVTAKPIEQNVTRMNDSGGDGFLLKPFRAEDLVQLVRGLALHTAAK